MNKTPGALLALLLMILLIGIVLGTWFGTWAAARPARATSGRERVELVTWRTRLPHDGCPSNGCWEARGAPRMIEAYGINKAMWPHRCSGCAATNEIYDARWPRIDQEWRPAR